MDIAVKIIWEKAKKPKISKQDLAKLFEYATSKAHILFNGTFYDQIDGVSMGSPLAPTLWDTIRGNC